MMTLVRTTKMIFFVTYHYKHFFKIRVPEYINVLGRIPNCRFHLKSWSVRTPTTAVCPGWCPTSQRQFGMHPCFMFCKVLQSRPKPLIYGFAKLQFGAAVLHSFPDFCIIPHRPSVSVLFLYWLM